MFFTRLEELCKAKGKSTTAVCAEIGIAKTTVSYWRNKADVIPKQDVLIRIANYFNVSVDYLLGEEDKNKKTTDNDGLTDAEKELLKLFNAVPENQRQMVLQMIRAAISNL
jgi:transcriptional regulator with XRE-family HTH domain